MFSKLAIFVYLTNRTITIDSNIYSLIKSSLLNIVCNMFKFTKILSIQNLSHAEWNNYQSDLSKDTFNQINIQRLMGVFSSSKDTTCDQKFTSPLPHFKTDKKNLDFDLY